MAVLGRRTDMDILVTDVNLRGDKRAPRDFRFGPPSGPVQPEFDSLRLTLSGLTSSCLSPGCAKKIRPLLSPSNAPSDSR
jgi:hypothetical protein